jgi:hypothetical protein
MGTVNGTPTHSFTLSGQSCTWYSKCTYPSGNGTAKVSLVVTTPSGITGGMYMEATAYIDNTNVGSYKNTYMSIPTTRQISDDTKAATSVGPGNHTFKINSKNSTATGVNGDSSGSFFIPAVINSFNGTTVTGNFSVNYTSAGYTSKLRISIPNVVRLETLDDYSSGTVFTLSAASVQTVQDYMTQQGLSQVNIGVTIETWNGSTKKGESSEVINACTLAMAPSYSSVNASQIGATSARLTASVNDNGSTITSGGFELSTDGGTTWTTYTGDWTLMTIATLTRVTTYTYRGFATNAIGTTYSSTGTFTTLAEAPSYNSISASNITATSATITAVVDDGGSTITAGGFQLSTDGGSTWTSYSGSTTSQTISGLTPSTTYTYRGYATNAIDTTYSSSGTFTTLDDSNVSVSINGAAFTKAKMKVSINGQAFVDLSSGVKTSINGQPFN